MSPSGKAPGRDLLGLGSADSAPCHRQGLEITVARIGPDAHGKGALAAIWFRLEVAGEALALGPFPIYRSVLGVPKLGSPRVLRNSTWHKFCEVDANVWARMVDLALAAWGQLEESAAGRRDEGDR
ncbi:MAG: hypothetical protein LAO51_14705 [Acidobacteriia bacterium]|nr:hypothetical protein [Terriglobia bacterium]